MAPELCKIEPLSRVFKKISGGFEVSDAIQFKELVMGVPYDIKGTIQAHNKSEDGFQIKFETMSGFVYIHFIGDKTTDDCRFTYRRIREAGHIFRKAIQLVLI